MDVSVVNPFLEAAVNVFRNMFSLEVRAGKPRVVDDAEGHDWDLSGLIGLTGGAQGIVAIRLGKTLASGLVASSGVDCAAGDDMVTGLVAELTNIVSGNATTALSGLDVEISPPVVVEGANHRIAWPRIAPVIGVPFETDKGPFEIDVCFKR